MYRVDLNVLAKRHATLHFKTLRIAIAKDRSKWRQLSHSVPKPPDAWLLKDTSRENDYNYITQKDTQPSQTCSEGYIFLLLYATLVFLYIFGEY